ncbi:DNA-binding SARP family transcriptional activator [Streptomyces sp. 1114.5]|uniref:AfsR/SARP family transcriptional regulator n=1 Tax=unclassified Streptomyces TaxID=2593676 RepID=UPI000BCA67EB|nr:MULTISPECIES: BTAD domain-containing putative transcriptional regulator [unclassified Streptomyces]RKT20007.1 DNA-binding SARP family transcriptional activator [Streptomyces sp. 1114.5]SOB86199.1 DNA-binding transcriptional activator of the SARP family [Streptomyces sp. 1331.2]
MTPDQSGACLRPPGADLRLLGCWQLALGGRTVELPPTARRILTLLALRGPVARAAVSCTLWPEADEGAAAGRLRTALWRLSAGQRLVETRGEVLALAAAVRVDVRRMVAAAQALRDGGGAGVGAGAAVGAGVGAGEPPVELFTQDLLPNWYEDWLVVERERVRQIRLHALEALSARMSRQKRYVEAVDAALVAVLAEPLRESSHRAVIRAHLAEGNVAEAVRQYETCRVALREQLGVEPSAELAGLMPLRTRTLPARRSPTPAH